MEIAILSNEEPVQIKKVDPRATIPQYKHDGDAGFDFYTIEDYTINPGEVVKIRTGLAVAFNSFYEIQIRLRSSLAIDSDLIIPNAPCTIDSNYRGEILIPVKNISIPKFISSIFGQGIKKSLIRIPKGSRIAQGILTPVMKAVFKIVKELPNSNRGESGFGSTGK